MEKLAHSAQSDPDPYKNVPEQTYKDHVEGVTQRALKCAEEMLKCCDRLRGETLKKWLLLACKLHDLGKLLDSSQEFLAGDDKFREGKKMVNHTDAGAALLLRKAETLTRIVASILIEGHHVGLLEPERVANDRKVDSRRLESLVRCQNGVLSPHRLSVKRCRDNSRVLDRCPNLRSKVTKPNEKVCHYVDRHLDKLVADHVEAMGEEITIEAADDSEPPTPIELRFLLSWIVEGDHGDTANHYKSIVMQDEFKYDLQPDQRLALLKSAIKDKQAENADKDEERQLARDALLRDCCEAPVDRGFYFCDATVGMGKTFSNTVLAMRIAHHMDKRRFFWISPFDNITSQTADLFRNIMTLSGEDREMATAAHHHQAEYFKSIRGDWVQEKTMFQGMMTKITNTLWESPIVVTTAVQFVETLASNKTSRVRKLNKLPGSVIVIDESDACVPMKLLRQLLKWLKMLVDDYGCVVIFLSGTMFRFWETSEFGDILGTSPYCVVSRETRQLMEEMEKKRISYNFLDRPLTIDSLCRAIVINPGPRLVVMNTIVNASMVAWRLEEMIGEENVEHISTAICPKTRKKILSKIKKQLERARNGSVDDQDLVLVATSCIEAGVDISFRSGFREKASIASVFQSAGRVNRECEYEDAVMTVFELCGNGITRNPQLDPARAACNEVARSGGRFSHQCATEARIKEMRISLEHVIPEDEDVEKLEARGDMHGVREHCRVIEGKTCAVVIDPETKERLLRGEDVSYQEIEHASVQIYESKLGKDEFQSQLKMISAEELQELRRRVDPKLPPIRNDLMLWDGAYSDKYGYMEEFRK